MTGPETREHLVDQLDERQRARSGNTFHISKGWLAGIAGTILAAAILVSVPWAMKAWAQEQARAAVEVHSQAGAHPAAVAANTETQEDLREHEEQAAERLGKIESGIAVLLDRSGGRPKDWKE